MYIWGITKKYKALNWYENFMSGHISNFTWFGENAMLWAMELHTKKWGYIVFKPPIRSFGKYHGWWFYLSPNGTPWASTYHIGGRTEALHSGNHSKREKLHARIRKSYFGHGFNTEKYSEQLHDLNNKMDDPKFIQEFKKKEERKKKLKKLNSIL